MVVRLVRAGVGVLLLLIAVPLALAGGGLCVAMEHRAADDTFTAPLERLRSGGRAVVVPDIDALLRADAPFARGGQTTLSLSAVGSSGPLFIGLAPDTAVQRYLDGLVQARVSRVRLARGPLPVELTEIETRAAAASAGAASGGAGNPGAGSQTAGPVPGGSGPAVAGPGTGAAAGNPGDPNAGNPGAASDPAAAAGNPGTTAADPNAGAADPNANVADPNAAAAGDPNAATGPSAAGDPNAGADPNAAAAGAPGAAGDAGAATGGADAAGGIAMPLEAPAGQAFWLAKSITVGGAAQLNWSPSALRGRHLALVVMNADGTAGINAAVTARLTPEWIGPTAGGLLMLGAALFLLALLVLAWPQRRAEERLVLPTLPSQPTKGRGRMSLRRNLATLSDPIAALLNPVVPKNRDAAVTVAVTSQTDAAGDRQITTVGVVVTEESPAAATATADTTEKPADRTTAQEPAGKTAAQEPTGKTAAQEPAGKTAAQEPAGKTAGKEPAGKTMVKGPAGMIARAGAGQKPAADNATAGNVTAKTAKTANTASEVMTPCAVKTADTPGGATAETPVAPEAMKGGVVEGEVVDVRAPQPPAGQTTGDQASTVTNAALVESELDRPAPAAALEDDGPGPVVLPPLPKLPAIELQFTWAPIAVDEQEEASTSH